MPSLAWVTANAYLHDYDKRPGPLGRAAVRAPLAVLSWPFWVFALATFVATGQVLATSRHALLIADNRTTPTGPWVRRIVQLGIAVGLAVAVGAAAVAVAERLVDLGLSVDLLVATIYTAGGLVALGSLVSIAAAAPRPGPHSAGMRGTAKVIADARRRPGVDAVLLLGQFAAWPPGPGHGRALGHDLERLTRSRGWSPVLIAAPRNHLVAAMYQGWKLGLTPHPDVPGVLWRP